MSFSPSVTRSPRVIFNPATLDLRLGETAHRLRCSFLPDTSSVEEKLVDLEMEEVDLRDGAILERNRPYLVPLVEELRLPEYIRAKTNPREFHRAAGHIHQGDHRPQP